MIAGTFAPWLRSGATTRDSYRTAGLLQRLLGIDGFAGAALDALPLLAVLSAGLLALVILGRIGIALVIGSLLAMAMAALSIAALHAPDSHGVRVATAGPAITLVGCVLIIVAAAGSVARFHADKTPPSRFTTSNPSAPEQVDDQPD